MTITITAFELSPDGGRVLTSRLLTLKWPMPVNRPADPVAPWLEVVD